MKTREGPAVFLAMLLHLDGVARMHWTRAAHRTGAKVSPVLVPV